MRWVWPRYCGRWGRRELPPAAAIDCAAPHLLDGSGQVRHKVAEQVEIAGRCCAGRRKYGGIVAPHLYVHSFMSSPKPEGRVVEHVHEKQADDSYLVTGFLITVPEGESGTAHFYFGPPGLSGGPPLTEVFRDFSGGTHKLAFSAIFPGHESARPDHIHSSWRPAPPDSED